MGYVLVEQYQCILANIHCYKHVSLCYVVSYDCFVCVMVRCDVTRIYSKCKHN